MLVQTICPGEIFSTFLTLFTSLLVDSELVPFQDLFVTKLEVTDVAFHFRGCDLSMCSVSVVAQAGCTHESLGTGQALELPTFFPIMKTFHVPISVLPIHEPFEAVGTNIVRFNFIIVEDLLGSGNKVF